MMEEVCWTTVRESLKTRPGCSNVGQRYPPDKSQRISIREINCAIHWIDFLSCGQRYATFEQPQPVSFPKIICKSLILYKGYRIYQKERRIFPATIRSLGPGSAVEEKDKKQAETVKKIYWRARQAEQGTGEEKGSQTTAQLASLANIFFFFSPQCGAPRPNNTAHAHFQF